MGIFGSRGESFVCYFRSIDLHRSWSEPVFAIWLMARTNSHSVVAFGRLHHDSAFGAPRLERAGPFFAAAFEAMQPIGPPARIDRG
jgi:hypothetical protein